ncbi:serine/threonine-protein phosphatase [Peptacetobacter hominis]|uniref:Serine/threonine-protein phosphatase n=1 Tax=Peptacetobacter hominis TaxID=2743610 RepID=A0A544QUT3_9FIRM|nr:PP2C family protein-serine/threonine phosphatase [Peptacetobacter hominis]TQQ84461.1 serine/threonine-protein phosphatase [Peptacetobacter hominis]
MTDIKIKRMKNLVEISSIVTKSNNFFNIKDTVIDKMLEVVHPAKACVNIFYNNDYTHAYLVCSNTLKYIPTVFPESKGPEGTKIDFSMYPDYIHDAVREKKVVYVKNVFDEKSAEKEKEVAEKEGYIKRAVFPFVIKDKVVGFMTVFMTEEEEIEEDDIDFISSVASLMALSIEITRKNKSVQKLVNKLRQGVVSINTATKRLYVDKNEDNYLGSLTKLAAELTESSESIIILDSSTKSGRIIDCYNTSNKKKSNLYFLRKKILESGKYSGYVNNAGIVLDNGSKIDSYIYCRIADGESNEGFVICANASKYTNDDLNILSIVSNQIIVGTQIYEYNQNEIKNEVLQNELAVLNKQQKLIMDDANMICNSKKELYCYHRPAKVVGGDFYDAVKVDDRYITYIVADVMGHGIVSNYMVALLKGAFKILCRQYRSPQKIMECLNQMLFDEFDKMEVFATGIISVFDTVENTLTVSNAGHYCPIAIGHDSEIETDIGCRKGIPIGVIEDAEYTEYTIDADKYSMICIFTDGIIEVKNKNREEFGLERVEKILSENHNYSQHFIIEKLMQELKVYSGKEEYSDDIMLVMMKKNLRNR